MTAFPESFTDRRVCVVGLGYVGLTLATTLAEVGFDVVGVEQRPDVVEMLRRGTPHFFEPGMADRLERAVSDGRLSVEVAIPAESAASVYIITVGTPLDEDGRARLDMVQRASGEVADALKDDDLVIMRSTVKLGTTRSVVLPRLAATGRRFHLAFCPERTLEGKAMQELRWLPQIVSGNSHDANVRAAQFFQFVTPTVVRVTDIETAEMVKMVDNSQRDVQFAYANEVARLCDAVGVSAAEVIAAGKLGYPRTNLPLPGPVGGPCLSKDPYILAESMEGTGVRPEMTLAARQINERQPDEVASFLFDVSRKLPGFPEQPTIAMLGLAFKGRPATDDLRGTMAVPIRDALVRRFPGATVRGYDPEASSQAVAAMGVEPAESVEEAVRGADLVLLLNNHPALAEMPLEVHSALMARPSFVYDFWNLFDANDLRLAPGVGFAALGGHAHAKVPVLP